MGSEQCRSRCCIWMIVLAMALPSCGDANNGKRRPTADVTAAERRALEVSEQVVRQGDKGMKLDSEIVERKTDGSFDVAVWSVPKVPGSVGYVHVAKDGRVTAYERGK